MTVIVGDRVHYGQHFMLCGAKFRDQIGARPVRQAQIDQSDLGRVLCACGANRREVPGFDVPDAGKGV